MRKINEKSEVSSWLTLTFVGYRHLTSALDEFAHTELQKYENKTISSKHCGYGIRNDICKCGPDYMGLR